MSTTKHAALGSAVTVLDSELDSLATATNSGVSGAGTGTIYDGAAGLNLVADFELVLTLASAPTAGLTVDLYMVGGPDGTNYADADINSAEFVCSFVMRNNTAQRITRRDVPLPPYTAKFFVRNNSGQTTSGTSNTVKLFPHNVATA